MYVYVYFYSLRKDEEEYSDVKYPNYPEAYKLQITETTTYTESAETGWIMRRNPQRQTEDTCLCFDLAQPP